MRWPLIRSPQIWLRIVSIALFVCLEGIPFTAHGQMQTTTGINGTVTDASGATVPQADVVITDQLTGAVFKARTNNSGFYSFPSLLPGLYTVRVSKSGFRTEVVTDRRILATQPATVDVTLRVGETSQSITVSAEGAELLNTNSQDITGTITPTLVRNLPTTRGNFFDLLTLAPGVVPQQANGYNGGLGISQPSNAYNYVSIGNTYNSSGAFVGGNRDSASNVSVDGSNVQNPVYEDTPQLQSTDTIQELRVETANMSAEFGYGASGINVITRSGTNQYHGDVYEYLRNNAFDANTFFANQAHQTLAPYQQNLFGASLGGPIKKDKLLFFFNYEGLRAQQEQDVQEAVPPAAYRNGDFSVNANSTPQKPLPPVPIYNPYQSNPATGLRVQFPNNQIPMGATTLCAPHPTCVDPATIKFQNEWILQPNAVIQGIPVYLGTERSTMSADKYNVRVDFLKSSNATIYGRYSQTPVNAFAGSIDPLAGTFNPEASYNGVVHWIETINSNTVNHFFVGYTRPRWFLGRKTQGVPNVSQQIGISGTSNLPGGPDFTGTGYDMDTSGVFIDNAITNTYQLQDDLSHVWERHNLKAGVSLLDKRFSYQSVADDKGVFYFNGQYTTACPLGNAACAAVAPGGGGAAVTGLPYADYLMGATDENFIILNTAPYAGYQLYSGFYVEDSWKVTNKLTLNYGLRYEHWTPWLVPRNTTLTYNPSNGDPVYAMQNPLDYLSAQYCYGRCAPLNPSVPRTGYTTGDKDLGPRVGLAWEVTPSTVFRSSFGIYYDGNVNDNQLSNLQTGAAPFSLRYQQNIIPADTPIPTYTVSTQFGAINPTSIPVPNATPVNTYRFVLPYLPTAAVDQWSAEVEQRIGQIWGLSVSYVGSHTTHEFQFIDENAAALPVAGTALATETLQQRRVFSGWGQLGTWSPIGWGRYNGLLMSFKNSNPWHGLTLISNFQWTKNIVSSHWGYSDIGNQNFRAPYIWAGDYTADPPIRFVSGYSYRLPFGAGQPYANSSSAVLNHIISGWMVSGITTFMQGGWAPVLDLGPDQTGTAENNMPNRICNPNNVPGGRTYLEWFNPACFTPSAYGTWGNSNMAAFTVPGINNWDMAIARNIKTRFPRESGELQFRADMFNAFNHTQWAAPTEYITSYTSVSNGRIGGTRPARQIQFTLKYLF